jgi:hypothetical protein
MTEGPYQEHHPELEASFGTTPLPGSGKLDQPLPGFESRIAKLGIHFDYVKRDVELMQTDVKVLKSDLSDIKTASSVLAERVGHLPTKAFIVKVVMGGLTAASVLTAIILNLGKIYALASGTSVGSP